MINVNQNKRIKINKQRVSSRTFAAARDTNSTPPHLGPNTKLSNRPSSDIVFAFGKEVIDFGETNTNHELTGETILFGMSKRTPTPPRVKALPRAF